MDVGHVRFVAASLQFVLLPLLAMRGQNASVAGQISGHVYRSDTGKAIPDAVVNLLPLAPGKVIVERTTQDGSYSFAGLDLQGSYRVTAWLRGLNPAYYRARAEDKAGTVLNFKVGSKLDDIDLHLTQMADIAQMNDIQLATTYPGERDHLGFRTGRFSSDGKSFVFTTTGVNTGDPEQVWRYDMGLRRLEPITGKATKSEVTTIFDVESVADTLYILYARTDRPVTARSCLAVTTGGTKLLSQIPPAVKGIFDQRERGELGAGSFRFAVERRCHGCDWDVWVQINGQKRRALTVQGPDVVADSDQPILFYEVPGHLNGIGRFDLRTRRSGKLPLPQGGGGGGTELLAAKRGQNGFIVAYATRDTCLPELNPDGSPSWELQYDVEAQKKPPKPERVCFATFPDPK